MKDDLKDFLGPMKPAFLSLTPVSVLLGWATASWEAGPVSSVYLWWAFFGAVASHISVNAFNEYLDFRSGLDSRTQRTPFSGGTGTLQRLPEAAPQALGMALISLVVVGLVGLYFLRLRGLQLLPLGVFGMVVVAAYTPWITFNPFSCLIAPGLGFGPLMVMGTSFVLSGRYSWSAFMASLVPFFLVCNLLLLNQFPDVEADRSIGRRHLPVLIGRRACSLIYGVFLLLAYLSMVLGVTLGCLPKASLLGLLTFPLSAWLFLGALQHADDVPRLLPFMTLNVVNVLSTPVLMAVGLFLA
jgi:1,4-dihydroxy-2-naphthoate polyprenyltransferase